MGLVNTLHQFITEGLATIHPIPSSDLYETLEEWHHAAMATYDDDERDLEVVLAKYATILNGSAAKPAHRKGKLLRGPWITLP